MPPLNLYTCLAHSVPFLNIDPQSFAPLSAAFPQVTITHMRSHEELTARIAEPDIIATWEFPKELYAGAARLKAVFTPAAGKEWVEQDPAGKVPVCYGSFHGKIMAETLLAMILYFNNRFHITGANQSAHIWDRTAQQSMTRLCNQRVAIVGYGNIGRQCARMLGAMGSAVTGVQRTIPGGRDPQTGAEYVLFANIRQELERADHVVLILPSGAQTQGIITREMLSAMKSTAFLYNIGRGGVVDEEDLVWALGNRIIAGAGLDVFAQEPLDAKSLLWDMNNVLILPHTSAAYVEYGGLFVEELMARLRKFTGMS